MIMQILSLVDTKHKRLQFSLFNHHCLRAPLHCLSAIPLAELSTVCTVTMTSLAGVPFSTSIMMLTLPAFSVTK